MTSRPADHLDLEALQEALEGGGITEDKREALLRRNVPDLLIEALEDGHLDEKELAQLTKLGLPKVLLDSLQDGQLTKDEMKDIRAQLADNMKSWRESSLHSVFEILRESD